MEMSCEGRGERGWPVAVHLLAYLFDPTHPEFAKERERLRAERVERIRVMTTMMARDGLPVDPDQILADAGPEQEALVANALAMMFGDYLGSFIMLTCLWGVLALVRGMQRRKEMDTR